MNHRIYREIETDINIEHARSMNLLNLSASKLAAAEILEDKLRSAGITASARGHLDEEGCTALVFAQGEPNPILSLLDQYAIPTTPVDCIDMGKAVVHTYATTVMGQEVALAIRQASEELAR